jgi:DNA-binding XRE family transcriptional regulator
MSPAFLSDGSTGDLTVPGPGHFKKLFAGRALIFVFRTNIADIPSTSTDRHRDGHLLEEALLSQFGNLVRTLRKERGLTLEALARKIGTHKGYISGIEGGKVSPPSVKMIRKYAKALGQDPKPLVRIAWVDKAPEIIRDDALRFLAWVGSASVDGGRPPSDA